VHHREQPVVGIIGRSLSVIEVEGGGLGVGQGQAVPGEVEGVG
jgi:hypothetical protein